jgi:hypothetical protein
MSDSKIDNLNELLRARGLIGKCAYHIKDSEEYLRIHKDILSVIPSERIDGIGTCDIIYGDILIANISFTIYDKGNNAYINYIEKYEDEYNSYVKSTGIKVKVGKAVMFKFAFLMIQMKVRNITLNVLEEKEGQLFKYYSSLGFKCMKPLNNDNPSGTWVSRNENDPWKYPNEKNIGSKDYNNVVSWYYNCMNMEATPEDIINNCCSI